jgi:hypothetical protein
MRANPHPDVFIITLERERPIMQPDTDGPEIAHLFEAQGGMPWIGLS